MPLCAPGCVLKIVNGVTAGSCWASVFVVFAFVVLLLCCGRLVTVPVSTLLTRTTSPRLVQKRHREGRRGVEEVWRGRKEGGWERRGGEGREGGREGNIQ